MAESKTEGIVTPKLYTRVDPNEIPDEELDAMIEAQKAGVAIVRDGDGEEEGEAPSEATLSPEENTYKKRYGDLRTRYNQKIDEHKEAIEASKEEMEKARPEYVLPKTDEEIAAFAKEYPDLYLIVETVARKQAREEDAGINDRVEKLTKREYKADKTEAQRVLKRIHPDIDEIRDDQKFHDWAELQSTEINNWLYENETNGELAARAVDLYKLDLGIGQKQIEEKPSGPDNKALAAQAVTKTKGKTVSTEEESVWSNSEVAKLDSKEFIKHEAAIDKAVADGTFDYDSVR